MPEFEKDMLEFELILGVLTVGVLVVRELSRAIVQPTYHLKSIFDLRLPGSNVRRATTIVVLVAVTYAAVAAIAFAYYHFYGTTGVSHYAVAQVLPDGAAIGELKPGDRIDAVDGTPLVVGNGPSLVERVNAKQGAPVELAITRAGTSRKVTIVPRLQPDAEGTWLLGIRLTIEREHSSNGALGRAAVFPIVSVKVTAIEIWEGLTSDTSVEIGGPARIYEDYESASKSPTWLLFAAHCGVYVWLVCLVLDLLRASVLIRDKVRALTKSREANTDNTERYVDGPEATLSYRRCGPGSANDASARRRLVPGSVRRTDRAAADRMAEDRRGRRCSHRSADGFWKDAGGVSGVSRCAGAART